MRIGIYGGSFQSAEIGGGHTFEKNFLESLKKLETEHDIFFFYLSKKRIFEDTEHITFININPKRRIIKSDKMFKFWLYWYDTKIN